MSEVADATQIVVVAGKAIYLLGKISLKAAIQFAKLINTIRLSKWKGKARLGRLRAIKGDDMMYVNVGSEDKKELKKIQKEIGKIAKKEIKDLSENDSKEKIEEDVNKALTDGCNKILDMLRSQAKDDEVFSVSKDAVTKALGDSLNTGKHAQIVNKLLEGYSEVLKAAGPDMEAGVKTAVITEAIKKGAGEAGLTLSDEQAAQIGAILAKDGSIDADTLSSIVPDLPIPAAVAANILSAIPSQIPASVYNEALFAALAQTVEPYTTNNDVQKGIKQYGQGIEMMQDAKVVGPALGKAAEAVGKQFNVDPAGIADAFTMKMDEDEITRLITAYVSGGQETSYDRNLRKLGYADIEKPEAMSFYLKDFESKEAFLKFIDDYNMEMQDNGDEDMVISYTDVTGVMIKSVEIRWLPAPSAGRTIRSIRIPIMEAISSILKYAWIETSILSSCLFQLLLST